MGTCSKSVSRVECLPGIGMLLAKKRENKKADHARFIAMTNAIK